MNKSATIKSAATDHLHQLTIQSLLAATRNMAAIMDKAERHAVANDTALDVYLQARLFPNMFTLLQQVQYICYLAVDFARHFSDQPAPRVGYDEASWPALRQSLDTTADYLSAISPGRVAEHADQILPTFMDDTQGMSAVTYAATVIMPDVHFHSVIAYAILRHNGVPLGKSDYLGKLNMVAMA
jgi:uncharacterized protein